MKMHKTLFVSGILVFLTPFLGFRSHIDFYIYVVLGLIVVIISVLNIAKQKNHSGSVFSEEDPTTQEERSEIIEEPSLSVENEELMSPLEKSDEEKTETE